MKKRILVPILISLGLMAGIGLTTNILRSRPVVVPRGAKAGDFSVKPGKYKAGGMQYRQDSGVVIVPENRNASDSRLIALPIRIIHSTSPRPLEPIFYLAGGPGASNMGFAPDEALLAEHDVVMVGYRGVDGSSRLDCPEIDSAAHGDGVDATSPTSLKMMSNAMLASAKRLATAGVDLTAYSIPEVVADMETVRGILGYARIDLLSESYGTRVAQLYAYSHPLNIRRSAMIGVNPPGRFVWEPGMIDTQIEYYSRLFAADESGRRRSPDLARSMRKVSQAMPRNWLFFAIDPGKVKIMTHVLLYQRSSAVMAFDAWLRAEQGDPSGLALMSAAYDLMISKIFVWGDLLAKGGSADFDSGRDYQDLVAPGSIIGSPMSLLIWQPASLAWPIKPISEEFRRVQRTDVETLLINGSIDFSTPVQYGRQELLPSLAKGSLVTLAEFGHVGDFWKIRPQAADRLLTSFYASGKADDSLFGYVPMNFKVPVTFSLIFKVAVATGLGLIMLAALLLVLFIRRKRNKAVLKNEQGVAHG